MSYSMSFWIVIGRPGVSRQAMPPLGKQILWKARSPARSLIYAAEWRRRNRRARRRRLLQGSDGNPGDFRMRCQMLPKQQPPTGDLRRSQRRRQPWRQGTAVVEFAIVAPLLFSVVLAIMEFGRGIMVAESLGGAARAACRAASL